MHRRLSRNRAVISLLITSHIIDLIIGQSTLRNIMLCYWSFSWCSNEIDMLLRWVDLSSWGRSSVSCMHLGKKSHCGSQRRRIRTTALKWVFPRFYSPVVIPSEDHIKRVPCDNLHFSLRELHHFVKWTQLHMQLVVIVTAPDVYSIEYHSDKTLQLLSRA